MADPVEPVISFNTEQFSNLIKEQGLGNTAAAVADLASEQIPGNLFTYETLKDGTAPLLDQLPGYMDLTPDKRIFNDEAIISLFTNVQDFGKYAPAGEDVSPGSSAFVEGASRYTPEAVGAMGGASGGFRTGVALSNLIPAVGLPGIIGKGLVIAGSTIAGAVFGAGVADVVDTAVRGEDEPVVPSLQKNRNMGETTVMGLSMLTAPWTMITKAPRIASATGAAEFLDKFKNIASGRFGQVADDAIELTAKNAGISEKSFRQALEASKNINLPKFGGPVGYNLGFTRFNPAGTLFDPAKGPLAARFLGAFESGSGTVLRNARTKPIPFVGLETAAATGSGGGAYVAESTDPGDIGTRIGMEFAGSFIVPIPAQVLAVHGKDIVKNGYGFLKSYVTGSRKGALTEKFNEQSMKRIYDALRLSSEFQDQLNSGASGQEVMETMVRTIMANSKDADGNPIALTTADLAQTLNLPMSATLKTIERELANSSKELSVASEKGRVQFIQGAKNAIFTMIASGDPQAMVAAARLQQGLFEQNITDNMELSINKFYKAAEKLYRGDPNSGSNQVELSQQLYNVLETQIKNSKIRERDLWDNVGDTVLAKTDSFGRTRFKDAQGEDLNVPNVLDIFDTPIKNGGVLHVSKAGKADFEGALGSLNDDLAEFKKYLDPNRTDAMDNPFTAGRFYEMRSIAQDRAATLRANGKIQLAKQMDHFANALLMDLTSADSADGAYNVARAYSFARNNVFTRSFAGDMQGFGRDRALKMSPEELAKSLFAGGNVSLTQKIDEMVDIGRFGLANDFPDAAAAVVDINDSLDLVIRDATRKFVSTKIDPRTGEEIMTVNAAALDAYRKAPGTKEIFKAFPDLERDLSSLESAQALVNQTKQTNQLLAKGPEKKAFELVLNNSEAPMRSISAALSSDKPASSMMELVNLAKRSADITDPVTGERYTSSQALSGLKVAILDWAAFSAGGQGDKFNPRTMRDLLFTRAKGVDPTADFKIGKFMTEQGIMTTEQMEALDESLKQMINISEAFQNNNLESVLFKNPTPAKLLQVKMIGATLGQKAQETLNNLLKKIGLGTEGGGIGGGMVAAQGGSLALQGLLLRGPETARINYMTKIMANPELFGDAMNTILTKENSADVFKSMDAAFGLLTQQALRRTGIGIRAYREEDTTAPKPPMQPAPNTVPIVPQTNLPPSNQQGALVPPAAVPPTRFAGGAAPSPVQQPPARSSTVSSQPVDRARYAALFPNDIASGMIRQQSGGSGGIASLMG
jgi:hypothetical protein